MALDLRPCSLLPVALIFAACTPVNVGGTSTSSASAGGAMGSASSAGGTGGAAMASSTSAGGVGGATSAAGAGGSGGAGGAQASSSSSASASSSAGTGGGSCGGVGGLIGAADLLWSKAIAYPTNPGYTAATCWPTTISARTSHAGGVLMRADFPEPMCWVKGSFNGDLANLLARFDDAGQLTSSWSIVDFSAPPTLSHALAGGADVNGMGKIVDGESYTGIHPSYSVNFLGLSFNYNNTLPPDPKANVYVSLGALAGGPSGDAAVVASASGLADFGGGPMGGGLLRFGPNLGYQWAANVPSVDSLHIDDAGNTLVAGSYPGSFTSVCGALPPGHMLLVLDPAGGCVYQRSLPQPFQVAVDGAGNAIVAMTFSGTIDLGGGPLTAVGTKDLAIAKYSAAGAHLWSERFGGPGFHASALSVSANVAGEVALQGSFTGAVDFGAGVVDGTSPCGPDTFFAKLTPAGPVAWAKYLHVPGPIASAIDPQGAVLLVAPSPTLDLGSGPVLSTYGMAVAKLAP